MNQGYAKRTGGTRSERQKGTEPKLSETNPEGLWEANRISNDGFRLTYKYTVHGLINFDSNITPKIPSNWQNKLIRRRPLLNRRRSEKIG